MVFTPNDMDEEPVPVPEPDVKMKRIILGGDIPSPANPPAGCKFHTRCAYCTEICRQVVPEWREVSPNHFAACHNMYAIQKEKDK